MLIDIHSTSKPAGLNMHLGKTVVMFNDHVNNSAITVDGKIIGEADSYVYLGKTVTEDGDLLPEIRNRIALGWATFGKVDNIRRGRKASMKIKIKRKIHDEYIPSETWALNNTTMEKLAVAQRKIERIMLGTTLLDRKRNTWIRQETGVSGIINAIRKAKHRWAGHIARLSDNH